MAGLTVFQSHREVWVSSAYGGTFALYAPTRAARVVTERPPTDERPYPVAYHDLIVTWLKDAYTMETGIVAVLEKQVGATADFPAVRAGLARHLEETRHHVTVVETCLDQVGEDPSALKAGVASLGGSVQGMMMGVPEDSLVKIVLQDYSAEHMEIASYKALVVAAGDAGLTYIAETCEGILRDEEAMAAWLASQLPETVRETISGTHD